MKNSVLILGASLLQTKALEAARELGLSVHVVDGNSEALLSLQALYKIDATFAHFYDIDLKDREGILELATKLQKEDGLLGIFTCGTDFSASVSYVTNRLGLPGHTMDAALNATVKSRMRECFAKAALPSPKYRVATTLDDAQDNIDIIGLPCVIKPVDSMGARGVRMLEREQDTEIAFLNAQAASRSSTVIIEEYMEGKEYSIDALVYNGTITITGLALRHIHYEPYFIEMGHTMSAVLNGYEYSDIVRTFAKGVAALGLTCGAAKGDVKLTKNGAAIGEIAARLSGGYMSGWTYPAASGFNLTKAAIQIACNMEPVELLEKRVKLDISGTGFDVYDVPCNKISAERAFISIPGVAIGVHFIAQDRNSDSMDCNTDSTDEWIKKQGINNMYLRPNLFSLPCTVTFPKNNVEKCGNVIATSSDRKTAITSAENAISNILIELAPNNKKTDNFLYNCLDKFPPSAFPICFEELCNVDVMGVIAANTTVESCIPSEITRIIALQKDDRDWSCRTIMDNVKIFDALFKEHKEINQLDFWYALFRGGLQAAVYTARSISL